MKIKKILKTFIFTLTVCLGICSLASCNLSTESDGTDGNKPGQVAEGVHGSKVELEILLRVNGKNSAVYRKNITRSKYATKLSDYLTGDMTREIRDYYGVSLKEEKLYQLIGGNYDKIEAEFDNMVLVTKISVWTEGEYNNLIFAEETVKAFENNILQLNKNDEELYFFENDKATGKIIDDLFKQYATSEGKELGDYTDFNAVWDKTTNTIKGNVSTAEEYTTSTTITYENLTKTLRDLIDYDKTFSGENVGGYDGIKTNFKVVRTGERGLLSEFIIETTVDNKNYNYKFSSPLHTRLEITITDNATNAKETYKIWFD